MIAKKIFFLVAIIFIFSLISWWLSLKLIDINLKYKNKTLPQVFFNGINLGEKERKQLEEIVNQKNHQLAKEKIEIWLENQPIATFSGQELKISFPKDTIIERAMNLGREKNWQQRLSTLFHIFILKKPISLNIKISYEKSMMREFINKLEEIYNKPARNALFKFENNRVIAFKEEEIGQKIITEKFWPIFEKEISIYSPKKIIVLRIKKIYPEITLSKANNYGIEELIGLGQSNFKGSSPERIHNIKLAALKINGVIIPPNEIFSFNKTVGDISVSTGYKKSYIIKEGKTILDDGGGVCQVSTTLFRATLNAGLPILERVAHAYRVHYYENDERPGFDATVFAPFVDFKFKNDTKNYLLLQTTFDEMNTLLTILLYGKKDGRKSVVSDYQIWGIAQPPESKYQEEPGLKKGVVKQIEWPSWGAKTSFVYQVFKENKVVFNKTFFSSYQPWPAVFLVGISD